MNPITSLNEYDNDEYGLLKRPDTMLCGYNGRGEKLQPAEVMNVMKTNMKASDNSDEIFDIARELKLPIDKFAEFIIDMPSPKNTRSVIYSVEKVGDDLMYDQEVSSEESSVESSRKEDSYRNFAAPMTPLNQSENNLDMSEDSTLKRMFWRDD